MNCNFRSISITHFFTFDVDCVLPYFMISYAEEQARETGDERKNRVDKTMEALQPYAEAVLLGFQSGTKSGQGGVAACSKCTTGNYAFSEGNSTGNTSTAAVQLNNHCHVKYPDCPATSEEIMDYIETISLLEY